ncbi:MAG: phytoene desaturase, partial [Hymenobacteraceae bacterium]|nr:phytoene desaturase [Hymenobacteraceae bacterium]MDX5395696.1 phytoene desaturase [Hymenobacteraceae bacterium]MDX5511750.1 phytoene desaturase [Hymenobacteraceae bacterium]
MPQKNIVVLGAGFAGISAAACLAAQGHRVTVLEKNSSPGGRARSFKEKGFLFDMGPSWYWMPDVFESFFSKFNKKTADYYQLTRLDPSYTVIFGDNDFMQVPAQVEQLQALFENYEQGSSQMLGKFLEQAAYKYRVGMQQLVYKPGRSVKEFINLQLLADILRMDIFQTFHKHIRRYFKHEKLLKLMEFPVLFLGALPQNTPALYSLMNYADISLGTWYPLGGMYKIVEGMVKLAEEQGVTFCYNQEATEITVEKGKATKVVTSTDFFAAYVVVTGDDYHHTEQKLLAPQWRNYSSKYWDKRVLA